MKPKHPLTLLRRHIKEDLCAAFPYVQFVVRKSEKERRIEIYWCDDDTSKADVAAIAEKHSHEGINYHLGRFDPCALCGSTEFVQGNDETMKMDYLADPTCMRCVPDFGMNYDEHGSDFHEMRQAAERLRDEGKQK